MNIQRKKRNLNIEHYNDLKQKKIIEHRTSAETGIDGKTPIPIDVLMLY